MMTARSMRRELRALGQVQAPPTIAPAVMERLGLADTYAPLPTAIGRVWVAFRGGAVVALRRAASAAAFESAFRREFGRSIRRAPEVPERLLAALRAVLAGERPKGLHFDLSGLSEFERAVLAKAVEVPAGEVRTYAWVAREIGRPAAVRAVGTALGRNPIPLLIPCHRIVRSDGRISGYIFGRAAKRSLLAGEGVDPAQLDRLAGAGVRYLGSDTTRIYCFPTCRAARRIAPHHRVPFRSERHAAGAGYRPCRICRPAAGRR
jgi:O-6-methylguanine DNA methyltransferase